MKSRKEGLYMCIVRSPANYRQLYLTPNWAWCAQMQPSLCLASLRLPGGQQVSVRRHQERRNQPQPLAVCSKDYLLSVVLN